MALRRIRLCADDYGLAPGVNAAICDLLERKRLNATSVMMVTHSLDGEAVERLLRATAGGGAQIGMHLTLTAPFAPLTHNVAPLRQGRFLTLAGTLAATMTLRFDAAALRDEVDAQLEAFRTKFGRPPDFVDGHQHVQLLPQVREAVLVAAKRHAPAAWARQCGRAPAAKFGGTKEAFIHLLSQRFRALAAQTGVATNPAFAGAYRFDPAADFAALFPRFLAGLPDGGLIMCHPGLVDDELRSLDPLTDLREHEYRYLAGEQFPRDLAAAGADML